MIERDVRSSVGQDEGDGGSYDQVGRMRARKGELVGDGAAGGDVIVTVDRVVGVVGAIYLVVLAVDTVGDVVVFRGVDTGVVAAVDRVVSLVGAPHFEVMAVDMVGDVVAAVENGGVADNVAGGDVTVAVNRVVGVVGAIYLVVLAVDIANDIVDC